MPTRPTWRLGLEDRLQPPDVYKWPLNVVVVRSGSRTYDSVSWGQGQSSRISRGSGSWPRDWAPPASIPHP